MKHKKAALLFVPLVVVFFVVGLIYAWSTLTSKYVGFNQQIGEKQFDLINSYQKGEKTLFYIDQSSKYSSHQAVHELAKKGGCNEGNNYLGYAIWDIKGNSQNNNCVPEKESAKNLFLDLFPENLDTFLSKYEPTQIPKKNYKLNFKNNNLVGIATESLNILINNKDNEKIGQYSIKPNFKVNLNDYDFSDYDTLKKSAEKLLNLCKEENFELCVNDNKLRIFNNDNFILSDSCESEKKEKFYETIEYIESCSLSEDNSCICIQNNPSGSGSFQINQEGNNVIISDNNKLKETIENVNLLDDSYVYILDASYVYKDHEDKAIIQGYFDTDQCTPKPKSKFRFCVQSKSNKFYVFDETTQKLSLKPVEYKFALDFGEQSITEIKEFLTDPGTQELLDETTYILAASCKEEKEKTIELAHNLASFLSERTQGIVIDTSSSNTCYENQENDFYVQFIDTSARNVFIVIETDIFGDGSVEFSAGSGDSQKFSEDIIDSLSEENKMIQNPIITTDPKLKLTKVSSKIIFTPESVEKESNPELIFEALKQYVSGIPFSYREVQNPGSISRGLVQLNWVWEIAKEENINYHLLLAIIRKESSFVDIRKPNDGEAHGLGQQFVAAIKDIESKLKNRYPELKDKSPEEIYENVLTSKDENSLKVQITATALFLHRTKEILASKKKPTSTRTVIQAYHDGAGNIYGDGSSKLIKEKDKEAIDYYPKVAGFYDEFLTAIA